MHRLASIVLHIMAGAVLFISPRVTPGVKAPFVFMQSALCTLHPATEVTGRFKLFARVLHCFSTHGPSEDASMKRGNWIKEIRYGSAKNKKEEAPNERISREDVACRRLRK